MKKVILETTFGKKTIVGFNEELPRKGESILLTNMAELYDDEHGQSPLWEVVDVIHCCCAVDGIDETINIFGTTKIVIKNEEDE